MKFKNKLEHKMMFFIMLIAIMLNVILPCFSSLTLATDTNNGGIDWNDIFITALVDQISLANNDNSLAFTNSLGTLSIEIPKRVLEEKNIGINTQEGLGVVGDGLAYDNNGYKFSISIKISETETYTAELGSMVAYTYGEIVNTEPVISAVFKEGTLIKDGKQYKCTIDDFSPDTGEYTYYYQDENGEWIEGGTFSVEKEKTEIGVKDDGQSSTAGIDLKNQMKNEENLDPMEKLVALLLNGIANGINSIVASVFNRPVTMEDLIFNHYPETQISFFKGDSNTTDDSGSGIIAALSGTISTWYSIFRKIAVVVYLILLVYMGVRIMLSSTGKNMVMYKNLFMYWCIGVAILFLYPYVMKYTIELNNTFVKLIENSKSTILGGNDMEATTAQSESVDSLLVIDFDKNPFAEPGSNSSDYMATISSRANASKRFALSLTYLILTWQLVTLIVYYYKRVFIVALLIVIFPLVVASFAIDRIADGKSQAFNKWNKEFFLNTFIQSFHAIVYIFVCGTISVTMLSGTNATMDYVLILTGVTFMFTGEDIIKRIFSQGNSATAKSLGETAGDTAKVVAAATLAKRAASAIAKPVVGKDSVYNKMKNVRANTTAAGLVDKNFDRNATPQELPHSNENEDSLQAVLDDITNDDTLTPVEKITSKREARELSQAINTFNNPNDVSAEQLANAYNTINNAIKNNPNSSLLNNIKLSPSQMAALASVGASTATMLANQVENKTINRDVTQRMSMILEGVDDETAQKYMNAYLQNMATYGTSRGYTTEETQEYADNMLAEINRMSDSFKYSDKNGSGLSNEDIENAEKARDKFVDDVMRDTQKIIDQHTREYRAVEDGYKKMNSAQNARSEEINERNEALRGFKETIDEFNENREVLSESLAVFWGRESGVYSAENQLDALQNIQDLASNNLFAKETLENLGISMEEVETYAHVLSSKVSEDTDVSDETRQKASEMLEEYEGDDVDLREGYDPVDFSFHEAIKCSRNATDYNNMTQRINVERRMANQLDLERTKAYAQERIDELGIDVNAGRFDTETSYYEGMTKEEVHQQYEDASKNNPLVEVVKRDLNQRFKKK